MTLEFQVNVFKNLIETYDSWEKLEKYLESEEGGLFRIVDKDENGLCLIRYEKGTTNMNLPHSKWFRSVVWNTQLNRPVCVAPCKTSSDEFPYQTIIEMKTAGIICQENVEGFMINCFRMIDDNSVHITSRSKLDAAGTFYSTKSFRELFIEAYFDTFHDNSLNINGDLKNCQMELPKDNELSIFYSFLVQHVEHKIVKTNTVNHVYVIYKGIVYKDGSITIEDTPVQISDVENIPNIPIPTLPNQIHSYLDIVSGQSTDKIERNEVQEWSKKLISEKPKDFQGIILKDREGNRWRVRSEKYSAIRSLRGNSPSLRDRFSQLYTSNLLHKYLEYYPEESVQISNLLTHVTNIIKKLYQLYVELHILKTTNLDKIDKMYHPHIYMLHGLYMSNLRPSGKTMTPHNVQVYLHKLPWQRLSFMIRKIINEPELLQ